MSEEAIFPEDSSPLERISYITLPEDAERDIEGFALSPEIPLPVEPPADTEDFSLDNLSWEMIISAMLKIFAYRPDHEHIDYYRKFINTVQPNLVSEMTQTGIVKAKQNNFEVAEELFRALVNLAPEYESTYVNFALVLEQYGDQLEQHYKSEEAESYFEKAFAIHTKAIERHPESKDVHYNAGHFFLKRGNLHRAKEELNAYLRLSEADENDPHSDESRKEVENILTRISSHTEEDRIFTEAYDFIRMGEEERGISRIREFLETNPEVWNGWFLLGWGLRRQEHYDEAKDAFYKSLELESTNVDTYNELAICTMELEQYDEAKRHLEQALQYEPENTKIISNLGVLALKQGDNDLAQRFFRSVLEIDPDDPMASRFLDQMESS